MVLLERESLLNTLAQSLKQAISGSGQTIVLAGEAGIGKTSVVEYFVAHHTTTVRMLWGACEMLFTPRPLGPLYDMAPQLGKAFRDQLMREEQHHAPLFAALLHDLQGSLTPNLIIMEDIHWADEATLDLITFIGRRLHHLKLLLVLTYRDDELGPAHPLRRVIGDLPSSTTLRLKLSPLSEEAVAHMAAATGHAPHDIYAATEGNPFFVTELLANATMEVPANVRDAVLARAARLSSEAQLLLALASVIPNRIEPWLLEAALHPAPATLDECFNNGMLRFDKAVMTFRHELARQAIESALTPPQRQSAHWRVLQAWLANGVDQDHYARALYHAVAAQEQAAILQFAPLAALYASRHGNHSDAATHYATLLDHARSLSLEEQAGWLEAYSYECYLTGKLIEAEASRHEALAYWIQDKRQDKEGHNLRWLSRLNWYLGKSAEAEYYALQAVHVLEALPANAELAMAYSNMAQLQMLAENLSEAVEWGNRAISLAATFDDPVTLAHALNNVGSAELNAGQAQGREKLERSLSLSLELGLEEHVARAYVNLVAALVTWRSYLQATQYLEIGIAYTTDHDLDSWLIYLRAWQARLLFETGDWDAATQEASVILSNPRITPISKIPALVILGKVRLRRDDPGGWQLLDEALALAQRTGELQRIVPVAAARAEGAWFRNDRELCRQETQTAFELALHRDNPWDRGELAYWMWRVAALTTMPTQVALPFALHIAGDWQAAALAWQQIGCPFEQAMALADGDETAQRQALAMFEQLHAQPAAAMVRRQLRSQGIRQIPRGPRATTQKNPIGLTNRQLEVLTLLADGLPNAVIAKQLTLATKTIDHHVAAILMKLDAQTRAEAIAIAYQMEIITPAMLRKNREAPSVK